MSNEKLTITTTTTHKPKPDFEHLEFGKVFTDHMFVMDYSTDRGWHDARIIPYQPLSIDPSAMIFHYGQTVFEGLKAYYTEEGKILLFRPDKNMQRLNQSNDRLCIPEIDETLALDALKELIKIDHEWVPRAEGTSLYIRPFIIATQASLGVHPSESYKFIIIMSPVGSYYKEGIKPIKIAVESKYVRAVAGGTGQAKTAGNYAASLKAQEVADEEGYSQVLWLDGVEKKYIEEVGSMNIFFKINGEVITPALNGSILPGITRDSILHLLRHWNVPVAERRISMEEVYEAHQKGLLEEVFGTGTAAVISPVGELYWHDKKLNINNGEIGDLSLKLYTTLTSIQLGKAEDPFGWTVEVEQEVTNK